MPPELVFRHGDSLLWLGMECGSPRPDDSGRVEALFLLAICYSRSGRGLIPDSAATDASPRGSRSVMFFTCGDATLDSSRGQSRGLQALNIRTCAPSGR